MIAPTVALVPVNLLVFRRLHERRVAPDVPALRVLLRLVSVDCLRVLFLLQCGTNALLVPVAAVLGVQPNAVCYVGWLLGTSAELVAYHFCTSLTTESARDEPRLGTYDFHVLVRALFVFASGESLLCLGAATSAIIVSGGSLTTPVWSVTGVAAAYLTAQVAMAAVLPPLIRLLRATG